MTRKIGTLTILLFVLGQISYGQTPGRPKQLKVKGTYVHSPTMTEFPESIGAYQRQGVYSFDKKNENIGSTYKSGETTLSVYIFPAGEGSEGRLRNQYLQAYYSNVIDPLIQQADPSSVKSVSVKQRT